MPSKGWSQREDAAKERTDLCVHQLATVQAGRRQKHQSVSYFREHESPSIPSLLCARFNIWFLDNLCSNRFRLERTSHSALHFYTLISTRRFLCIYHPCGAVGRGGSWGEGDDDEGGTIGLLPAKYLLPLWGFELTTLFTNRLLEPLYQLQ